MSKWQKEQAKTHTPDSVPRDPGLGLAGGGRRHQLVGKGRAEDCRDLGKTFLYWNPQITSQGQFMGRHKFLV